MNPQSPGVAVQGLPGPGHQGLPIAIQHLRAHRILQLEVASFVLQKPGAKLGQAFDGQGEAEHGQRRFHTYANLGFPCQPHIRPGQAADP